jgi:hypothetical protein
MPSTIHRKNTGGLTLLSAPVSVADDGLVSVSARFLLSSPSEAENFTPNYTYATSSFAGLPRLQNGLFVQSRNVRKENGLYMADVQLVGALNPPQYKLSSSTDTRNFVGTLPSTYANFGDFLLSWRPFETDYISPTVTVTAIVRKGTRLDPGQGSANFGLFNSRPGEVRTIQVNTNANGSVIGYKIVTAVLTGGFQASSTVSTSEETIAGDIVRASTSVTTILEPATT